MTHMFMYWFTRLDALDSAFVFLTIATAIATCVSLLYGCIDEKLDVVRKAIKIGLPLFLLFGLATILTPTTKEAAVIYLIPKIVNNEKMQNIAGTSLSILESHATKYLESLVEPEDKKKQD